MLTAMDAMDALDASAERNLELVAHVRPEQWDNPTPCAEWNVRSLVGHLIAGRHGYCALLRGAPSTKLRSLLAQQSEAAGADPVAACESAARSVRAAFAEPGALERTVHHRIGDIPGSALLALLIGDSVVHSWDLAIAIGVNPGLDEQLVEYVYGNYAPIAQSGAIYANGWFAAPATPLPEGATPLERLLHLTGRSATSHADSPQR
jgi:uncharacterized protein (TIGR03086 family)